MATKTTLPLHTLAPCANCPFRRGQSYLRPGRADEIASSHLVEGGGSIFPCHEHADGRKRGGKKHCAGAILFAMANGIETQAMQIGRRLGWYEPQRIRGARSIYLSLSEMVEGHAGKASRVRHSSTRE